MENLYSFNQNKNSVWVVDETDTCLLVENENKSKIKSNNRLKDSVLLLFVPSPTPLHAGHYLLFSLWRESWISKRRFSLNIPALLMSRNKSRTVRGTVKLSPSVEEHKL